MYNQQTSGSSRVLLSQQWHSPVLPFNTGALQIFCRGVERWPFWSGGASCILEALVDRTAGPELFLCLISGPTISDSGSFVELDEFIIIIINIKRDVGEGFQLVWERSN